MNKLDTLIILDRSTSMDGIREQVITWYNQTLKDQRSKAEELDITMSLVTAGEDVQEHHWMVPLSEVKDATWADYIPDGLTALFGGLGYGLEKMLETSRPDAAKLVVVITDGMENNSLPPYRKPEGYARISELHETCKKRPGWTIAWMGCDATCLNDAVRVGISAGNTAKWDASTPAAAHNSLRWCRSANVNYLAAVVEAPSLSSCDTSNYFGSGVAADFTSDKSDSVTINHEGTSHRVPGPNDARKGKRGGRYRAG